MDTSFEETEWYRRLARAFDWALVAMTAGAVLSLVATQPHYWTKDGFGLLQGRVLFGAALMRLALLVAPKLRGVPPLRRAALAGLSIPALVSLWFLLVENYRHGAATVVETGLAFHGRTERDVDIDMTEWHKVFPQMSVMYEVMDRTPPDARIAAFGDLRGHIMQYHLYPRRLYQLPELQRILLKSSQESFGFVPLDDPLHPKKNYRAPTDENLPQDTPDPAVQEAFWRMVDEKGIDWVLYYDVLYRKNSFLRRIDTEPPPDRRAAP